MYQWVILNSLHKDGNGLVAEAGLMGWSGPSKLALAGIRSHVYVSCRVKNFSFYSSETHDSMSGCLNPILPHVIEYAHLLTSRKSEQNSMTLKICLNGHSKAFSKKMNPKMRRAWMDEFGLVRFVQPIRMWNFMNAHYTNIVNMQGSE